MTIAGPLLFLLLSLSPSSARAADSPLRYVPPSRTFACDLPGPDWHAFEEEEDTGFAVHILGPDDPTGTYRTGIDVRWREKGEPGWVPIKKRIDDELRRKDPSVGRVATLVRPYRVPAGLARVFEVVEIRRLPASQLPSLDEDLHYYYAVIPEGESYYEIKLASTREEYLKYRDVFVRFLYTFRPIGVAGL
ncbi:MAG: hypothetical protein KGO96_01310 [Elusimicrobia bacterium]|nr:hypothetical protein [Elusimicrobiota bacterium]MDE2237161.1 hypothetical protein [Elusimicrobiota bacterium]MDE2424533.1 hypothetical protein [Elusimicrobiota bacterium]